MIKSYKIFRFYKRFCKKREKTLIRSTVNGNKETGKRLNLLITGCFLKPFKNIINHFNSFLLYIYNTKSKLIIREVCSW